MGRGKLSRDAFMREIRALTTDIVTKVKGKGDMEIKGDFKPIEVACPKCGHNPITETFRNYNSDSCGQRRQQPPVARMPHRHNLIHAGCSGVTGTRYF